EKVKAGYVRLDWGTEIFGLPLDGNVGVRYTRTDVTSTGIKTDRTCNPATVSSCSVLVNSNTVVSLSNSYSDILPAVNFNLEVQPNLFVRGTYAKNLARPKVTDLSPAIICTVDTGDFVSGEDTCSAGNPKLKPYRADQYDINVGWYPNRDTLLSVGYFYKNVNTFVLTPQLRNGVDLFGDGILYTVRQPINGQGAKLDGFEVSAQTAFTFLPSPFDGLGASANFTYSRALKTGLTNQATNLPLESFPGLSKYTYNASVFYDKARNVFSCVVRNWRAVVVGTAMLFLASAGLFVSVVPKQFFPASDRLELVVDLKLAKSGEWSQTSAVASRLERLLSKNKDVTSVATYI
ncbi:MAG: TonB-dependent receptor, partial [Oxalobacteraceae bacterium]